MAWLRRGLSFSTFSCDPFAMALYSTYWYRVADIKPRLRGHIRLHRHIYRNLDWYVIQDSSTNRQHRFNSVAYRAIGLMDGERTVQEIWQAVTTSLGDNAPTQDEMISLLGQLHAADVLQTDISPDLQELFLRQGYHRSKWKQQLLNPLAVRFPLVDPDRFLIKWLPLIKPIAGKVGALLWLAVVGCALMLSIVHWPELTRDMADRILTPKNLMLLWLVYPLVKLLHELAHAFAIRIWGGEVHEMGLVLLALTPIPYVEASASVAFPNKYHRMAVAAAGMAAELFVASLALFLWLNVEPGKISTIAYNVMLVGGVSTLLFNGNPLLRYDGYYLLADWLEIPNLSKRSISYLAYLMHRYLFGIKEAVSPVTAAGESPWFILYGITAFCYRLFVVVALALFISNRFFIAGVLIALWSICTMVLFPAVRGISTFYTRTRGNPGQSRIIGTSLLLTLLGLGLFVMPMPLRTSVEGVISLPEHSRVKAGTDCFVTEVFVDDRSIVANDDPLIRCEDPYLQAEVQVLAANLEESEASYQAEPLQSRARRDILREEISTATAKLARARERIDELLIRSPNQGLCILPDARNLVGTFAKQGSLLGYVIGTSDSTVVVVVSQADIALVQQQTKRVELRLASSPDKIYTLNIEREIPAASDYLPSPVLGTTGGGSIPVDPSDSKGLRTLQTTFQFELKLPIARDSIRIGERVYAQFDHGYEPLALQWYRLVRQLFLRLFHV